jgi:F0F1-type ATP synthase gamma subunit
MEHFHKKYAQIFTGHSNNEIQTKFAETVQELLNINSEMIDMFNLMLDEPVNVMNERIKNIMTAEEEVQTMLDTQKSTINNVEDVANPYIINI